MRSLLIIMAFAACAGVLRGATATQPATSATTDQESVAKNAAAAVTALAESNDSAVRVLAAKLAQVLRKHELAAPKTATASATTSSAELPEKEGTLVRHVCDKLPPLGYPAHAGLPYDLSVVVAEDCPDVATRLKATMLLVNPHEKDPNALRPSPAITARIVEGLFAKAFESRGGELTRDARATLSLMEVTAGVLFPPYLQAKAVSLDPLDKTSFEKAMAILVAQGEAAKKAVKKDDAALLAPLVAALKEAANKSGEFVEVGQSLKASALVARRLFDASNAGDIAAIRACHADPTNLDETGLKQPRPKLKFVDFRPFNFVPGNDGRIKTIYGTIQWSETDGKGVSKMLMEQMSFVKTERGWLAGD